jgi:hypothetical protein
VDTVGIETARLHKTLLHWAFLDYTTSQTEFKDRTKPAVLTRIFKSWLRPGFHSSYPEFIFAIYSGRQGNNLDISFCGIFSSRFCLSFVESIGICGCFYQNFIRFIQKILNNSNHKKEKLFPLLKP